MVIYRHKLTGKTGQTDNEQKKLYKNGCRVKKNWRDWEGLKGGRDGVTTACGTLLGNTACLVTEGC